MASWEQIFKNLDKQLDCEEIDEFLDHLNASINRRIRKLEENDKNISTEEFEDPRDIAYYRDHLNELIASSYAVKALGDELSIVALYKKVETHTGIVIKRRLPAASSKKISYFKQLCEVLPFDIKTVDGFSSFNELRLINNSIKHEGKVSVELAQEFPAWQKGAELSDLGKAFHRLLPGVRRYVADLAEKLY